MKSLIPCCVVVFLFHSVLQAERIVDFGHDWGVGFYRDIWTKPQGEADIDGDGDTSDDHPKGWDFRMDIPLNPTESTYDDQLPTATFYGGVYAGVTDPAGSKRGWPSEGHINQNHEMRDDWNLMALPSISKQPELESYEAAGIWLWKKADFLNGASRGTVRFAAGDFIAVYVSRYWGGIHWGRWMLQDGDTFYVSEPTFGNRSKAIDLSVDDGLSAGRNPIVRTGHLIQPSEVKWAVHTPNRNAIRSLLFDVESAEFKPRKFHDVQAVGFMVQRNLSVGSAVDKALSLNEPIALKFNAVHVEATVDRPSFLASPHVDLVGVGGTEDQPSLWAGKTEVTYEQWLQVFRWADSNQRVRNHSDGIDRHIPPYAFVRDGAIGSAEASLAPEHLPHEPVTTITWLDAVVWCNALSELYGLESVYRNEEGQVEREASPFRLTTYAEYQYPNEGRYTQRPIDTAMVFDYLPDPKRNGFRLPTVVEMRSIGLTERDGPLNKAGTVDTGWFMENSGGKAHPVGTKTANAQGIHDALGNVQEWTYGGSSLFGQNRYGNDFVFASDNYPHTMNRQDHVSSARAYLGFRPVRRAESTLP